jgi:AcrR family transcriptional regulator
MSISRKRTYVSKQRDQAASVTRSRVLTAATTLFARRGIDAVTIAQIAKNARVSSSTIYGLFKSKEGILEALMSGALFGDSYQKAIERLAGVSDPVELIAMTAGVARAIYESETAELGLIRGASAFSPALRKLEQEFESTRLARQEERLVLLYAQSKARKGLALAEARHLLWMYTSRDVYRMLVHDSGWSPEQYERWLSQTLVEALVADGPGARAGECKPKPSP